MSEKAAENAAPWMRDDPETLAALGRVLADLAENGTCPTCGPTTTERHPRRPLVTRCSNCKEWLHRVIPPASTTGGDQ